MKIAIAGGGFCGLSLAYILSKNTSLKVTLFEPCAPSMRASSLAHLLHPFIHPKAKCSYLGMEAYQCALDLIEQVSCDSKKPFFVKRAHLKLANHEELIEPLMEAAKEYEDLRWTKKTEFNSPALSIEKSVQVNSVEYLKALETACERQGVELVLRKITESDYTAFDQVVITAGHESVKLLPFKERALSHLKGQTLEFKNPLKRLPCAVSAHRCHIIPSLDGETLWVGSTYERHYDNLDPNKEQAFALMAPRLTFLDWEPKLEDVVSTRSGVRLCAPSRMPLLGRASDKVWVYSAMGSKGLLYHALLASQMARAIEQSSVDPIDEKFRLNTSRLFV